MFYKLLNQGIVTMCSDVRNREATEKGWFLNKRTFFSFWSRALKAFSSLLSPPSGPGDGGCLDWRECVTGEAGGSRDSGLLVKSKVENLFGGSGGRETREFAEMLERGEDCSGPLPPLLLGRTVRFRDPELPGRDISVSY